MEDPNLIATLIPVDKGKLAENAFRLPHNRARYLPPAEWVAGAPTISSREPTPAWQQPHEVDYDPTHRIQLTFSKRPNDPQQGYSFGTNPLVCDVLLGHRGAEGISGRHFCVTFDEQKRVVLRDSSTWGTSVSYDGKARDEVRHHFPWILSLDPEKYKNIVVRISGLEFKVELASHETCQREFLEKVNMFLEESQSALPPLDVLGIYSHQTTAGPSQPLSPRQRPIYLPDQELGKGAFGRVDGVIDVSTGSRYARKEFFRPYLREKDRKKREQQKEDWQKRIRREVHIMRNYPHMHIVPVVAFWEEPVPLLLMPYFPLGNLEEQHKDSPIAVEEAIDLLFRVLEVLDYLHPRGVTHRDMKPENILVDSRNPLGIKVADFGLAKDTPNLKTFCGTPLYSAPEIYWGEYSTAMDLWPLGLMVLEYAFGLKKLNYEEKRGEDKRAAMKMWGLSWCGYIVVQAEDKAEEWKSDPLINLLSTGMLKIDPKERLSAGECLKRANDLRLFDSHAFGSATPIRRTTPQGEISDDDGSTTIILGNLWNPAVISSYEDNRRTQFGSPRHAFKQWGDNRIQASVEPQITQVGKTSSHEDDCRTRFGNPGPGHELSERWGGNNIQASVQSRTTQVLSGPSYGDSCRKRFGSPGIAFEQWGGSIQASVELRTTQILRSPSYEDKCKIRVHSPGIASQQWVGNRVQASMQTRTTQGQSAPGYEESGRTRFGSPEIASEQWLGNRVQASVEPRTTQIRRASKSINKRHGQTRSSSHRTSERLKHRRKTVPDANVSWTIAPESESSFPPDPPDLRIAWQKLSSFDDESAGASLGRTTP